MRFSIGEWTVEGTDKEWTTYRMRKDKDGNLTDGKGDINYFTSPYPALIYIKNKKLTTSEAATVADAIIAIREGAIEIRDAALAVEAALRDVLQAQKE